MRPGGCCGLGHAQEASLLELPQLGRLRPHLGLLRPVALQPGKLLQTCGADRE
jgi:hypothetical protein